MVIKGYLADRIGQNGHYFVMCCGNHALPVYLDDAVAGFCNGNGRISHDLGPALLVEKLCNLGLEKGVIARIVDRVAGAMAMDRRDRMQHG